jgi:GT2 family glycosyltransferase/O-antigen/teichoic acid export membrane protein
VTADVAVVVVNYRTPELTAAAVSSVVDDPCVAEVVVVDNHSCDGSLEHLAALLPSPEVRILAAPANGGFGRGADLGVRAAGAPLVLLLNSDATVEPGSIRLLRRALVADPSVGMVAPAVYGPDGRTPQRDAYGRFPSLRTMVLRTNRHPRPSLSPDWVSGVAVLLRRADYLAVGGFDPGYHMYLEDVDLCWRLRGAGRLVLRVPEAAVRHRGAGRPDPRRRRQYHDSQQVWLSRRAASRPARAAVTALSFLRTGRRAGAGGPASTAPSTPPPHPLVRTAGLVTALTVLKAGLAFLATVAVTRALGPAGRGTVAFVVTAAGLLAWVVSSGTGPALTRATATASGTLPDLRAASLGAAAVAGTAMAGVWLAAFALGGDRLFGDVGPADAALVAVLIPALVATNNVGQVAALAGRAVPYHATLALASAGFLAAVLWLWRAGGLTPSSAVAAWSATAVAPLFLLHRTGQARARLDPARIARLVAASVRPSLAGLAVFGIWRVDVVVVKAQRGAAELGLYAAAVSVAEILLLLAVAVRASLLAEQGRAHDRAGLPAMLARATRTTAAAAVVGGAALAAAGSVAIPLAFGPEFAAAVPALVVLVPGVVALALHGPLYDFLHAEGRADRVTMAMGAALVLNVALDVVLLRSHTFVAAAVASTLAYGIVLAACVREFAAATGCSVASVLVPRRGDLGRLRPRWRARHRRPGPAPAAPTPPRPTART